MRKIMTFLSICVTVAFIALPYYVSSAENAMTNVELAELMITALGMTPPAGTEDLSEVEYYEVLSNMLASVGINDFVGTKPMDPIDCGRFVGIVFAMAGGTGAADTEGKIRYLVEKGYMPSCNQNSVITKAFAAEVFGNPNFAALVAEAYSPAGGESRMGAGAPGVNTEGVASKI